MKFEGQDLNYHQIPLNGQIGHFVKSGDKKFKQIPHNFYIHPSFTLKTIFTCFKLQVVEDDG